ncbi:MAG TPA: hypothetical protein VNP04_23560 [Alphaproteobacteria bacterium]|nr:hypothetical protein [Alphaproteobacteria bacterium]
MSSRLARIPGARIGVRYLYTSLGFWVFFHVGLVLWHQRFEVFYFRQLSVLALTHLAALGWLTTALMGVMYATLPATLGVRPKSLRLARVQYWLQTLGIAGLVLTMGVVPYTRGRVVFGLLTLVALVIFAHNIAATIGRGKEWRLPEAHFVMAMFYLAITGLIGMTYVFYLNWGAVPQTMTHLKVHAAFGGIGWLALTLMGLTYKLLPLELGIDQGPQGWAVAASVLINVVFWGVFFSYAYDWPALRAVSALLGLAALGCHTLQVWTFVQRAADVRNSGRFAAGERYVSLPYTWASNLFGGLAMFFALLLTTAAVGDGYAIEYALAYAAGGGWIGLFVVGQTAWLLPRLLHDEGSAEEPAPACRRAEWPGLLAGTTLVTLGLAAGVSFVVALGAAVNLAASLLMVAHNLRLRRGRPLMVAR